MALIKESIADEDERVRALGYQCLAGLAKHGDAAREVVMEIASVTSLISIVKTTKEPIMVNVGADIDPADPNDTLPSTYAPAIPFGSDVEQQRTNYAQGRSQTTSIFFAANWMDIWVEEVVKPAKKIP